MSRTIEYLRPTARINWSPLYNLHITTKFIGQWPEPRLPELLEALTPLGKRSPFEITISGIGWLPNRRSPRVLYAGIAQNEALAGLADDIQEATAALGIARETRAFRPHLTLARTKDPATPLDPLREALDKLESQEPIVFTADYFALYASKPGPAGSIYSEIERVPFQP